LHDVLSIVPKSCSILLYPSWDLSHSFVQCVQAIYTTLQLVT
jgi:hypothetical protein